MVIYFEKPLENDQVHTVKFYTSLKSKEVGPIEPVQMNNYQSNTCRKDLNWLHFDDDERVQER